MASLLNVGRGLVKMPYDAEVEYLAFEKTHTFAIETRVAYSRGLGFGCEISHFETTLTTSATTTGYNQLMGNYLGSPNRATFYVGPTNHSNPSTHTGNINFDFGSGTNRLSTKISGTNKQRIEVKPYSSSALIVYINNSYKKNVNIFTPSSESPIKFLNSSGSYAYEGRVYRVFVYDTDGTYLFDAIPVRVGTVGYMYDTISRQLFGNAGTGDFILGNDI